MPIADRPAILSTGALALLLALPPLFSGCAQTSPKKPQKLQITFEPIPGQILLFFQAFSLTETETAAAPGAFPAPGFRFDADRVVPADTADTVAGLELTQAQITAWMGTLARSGKATFYARVPLTVGPNMEARAVNSTEKRYQGNWHIDASAATPQSDSVVPETSVDVQPTPVPGTSDVQANVQANVITAGLEPFILSENFVVRSAPRTPLGVLLPREVVRRLASGALVRPGRSLILAHYVKQYRSASAQEVREHLFFVLSVVREAAERPSDLPIVQDFPQRYALSLTWNEWDSLSPPAAATGPQPPRSAGDELRRAAEAMKGAPNAVSQTLSLALTAGAATRFEVADNRSYVSGIHRDSDREDSPYNFDISRAWAGMKFEALLERPPRSGSVEQRAPDGVAAGLKGRLADPLRCDDAAGTLPSLRPDAEAKVYHFQVGSQAFADFNVSLALRPGETHLLAPAWLTSGPAAAPGGRERIVFVSLKQLSAPAPEAVPPAQAPSAPARP